MGREYSYVVIKLKLVLSDLGVSSFASLSLPAPSLPVSVCLSSLSSLSLFPCVCLSLCLCLFCSLRVCLKTISLSYIKMAKSGKAAAWFSFATQAGEDTEYILPHPATLLGPPFTWISKLSCSQSSSCRAETSDSRFSYTTVLLVSAWRGEGY